ncbi:PIN2/TERF1-interacting telomerase inhibitor 1 isoform X2 [Phyllopteryx taeniolatus]|uniref:PIN2/TERF1-interacting telomerase inhibitor 1 isoform X2 n=1 Tax=Phyllopteryx taeniolatus TaxID=161469 RepID=UPI002AD369FA|nr:PIN2/TERF1-interacting telomerase inhibitor 1 isoform X2 [Phyllopteryx taeniolatus]
MSMLAEPRRKQKWSTDPRNSAWSNDDSKFGQKMLERMGWSKGKGLGRSEQGATEHVQVKVKNNCYGLGAQGSQEDNWIAHQEDFNDLLAQLNNCHGRNNNSSSSSSSNAESPPELLQKGFSLEEKSKTSKKRVHYMKFAKGKDLSSRSATDLNCIFGKRAKCAAHPEQESAESPTDKSPTAAAAHELDTESITKTVTSTLTTQEYFAQRMARLKAARRQVAEDAHESEEPKRKKKKKEEAETVSGLEQAAEPSKKKKKKKKRPNEDAAKENLAEEKDSEERKEKKKKKPKYKMEMPSATPAVEPEEKSGEEQELVVHKKSKKLKKKQRNL